MKTLVRHKKTHWQTGFLFLFLNLFITANSQANIKDPDVLVKEATQEMITSINQHRAEIKVNPDKLKLLVEQIIIPHIDIITASKWVMGK